MPYVVRIVRYAAGSPIGNPGVLLRERIGIRSVSTALERANPPCTAEVTFGSSP